MSPVSAVAGKQLYIKCPVAGYPIESIVWEKGKHRASFLLIPGRIAVSFVCWVFNVSIVGKGCIKTPRRLSALIDNPYLYSADYVMLGRGVQRISTCLCLGIGLCAI